MTYAEAKAIFARFMIFPDKIKIAADRVVALTEVAGRFGKAEYDEVAHIAGNRLYADHVYSLDGKIIS